MLSEDHGTDRETSGAHPHNQYSGAACDSRELAPRLRARRRQVEKFRLETAVEHLRRASSREVGAHEASAPDAARRPSGRRRAETRRGPATRPASARPAIVEACSRPAPRPPENRRALALQNADGRVRSPLNGRPWRGARPRRRRTGASAHTDRHRPRRGSPPNALEPACDGPAWSRPARK